jgi:hypothetical protein
MYLPKELRRSLAADQGSEMALQAETRACPSNESTNELLRQYFPKGIGLHGPEDLAAVAELNARPRKTLGCYESPDARDGPGAPPAALRPLADAALQRAQELSVEHAHFQLERIGVRATTRPARQPARPTFCANGIRDCVDCNAPVPRWPSEGSVMVSRY